jgi:glycosyltransferase 2 family protein
MVSGGWTRARAVTAIAAVALAAALLVYSLRGIDWQEAGRIVRGASPLPLGLVCGVASLALFLRAIRWRLLLNAQGQVGVAAAFWATAAGYFGNAFLPARAGELVRTFFIRSRGGLDAAFVLTTALAERVVDAIALVLISAAVIFTLPAAPGWLGGAARPVAIAALAGALAIGVLPLFEDAAARLIERLPLPHTARVKLRNAFAQIARGLRSFHDPSRLAAFLGLTAVIWCLDAAGTVIGGAALGLYIPIPAAFLLIAGLSLGSALPSTPGYVGIFQFVAVTVLTPFGLSRTDAIAFIFAAQMLMFLVIAVWGSIGLARYRRAA